MLIFIYYPAYNVGIHGYDDFLILSKIVKYHVYNSRLYLMKHYTLCGHLNYSFYSFLSLPRRENLP
jgi:hypothetical protein